MSSNGREERPLRVPVRGLPVIVASGFPLTKQVTICIRNEDGNVVQRGQVSTRPEKMEEFLELTAPPAHLPTTAGVAVLWANFASWRDPLFA